MLKLHGQLQLQERADSNSFLEPAVHLSGQINYKAKISGFYPAQNGPNLIEPALGKVAQMALSLIEANGNE